MTYSRADQKITVEFDVEEFATLLAILGAALIMSEPDGPAKADIEKFIRDLNRTNPDYGLYANHEFERSDWRG